MLRNIEGSDAMNVLQTCFQNMTKHNFKRKERIKMKKLISAILTISMLLSCVAFGITAGDISTEEIDLSVFKAEKGINAILPDLFELASTMPAVETLISATKARTQKQVVYTENNERLIVSEVQVYNDSNEESATTRVTTGRLTDEMFVKVLYDNGESWVKFPANFKNILREFSAAEVAQTRSGTAPSPSSLNMCYPIDDSQLSDHYTCMFGCEPIRGQDYCDYCTIYQPWSANRSSAHTGQDISYTEGTDIRAAFGGIAVAGCDDGYGNYVEIWNACGLKLKYGHMMDTNTSSGYTGGLLKGTKVGKVGNTGLSYGAHLHYELNYNGTFIDPIPYLNASTLFTSGISREYLIVDGPLNVFDDINNVIGNTNTPMQTGQTFTISEIVIGQNYLYGKINSGANSGKFIALASKNYEIYAIDTGVWTVVDGPLSVYNIPDQLDTNIGRIATGTKIKFSDKQLSITWPEWAERFQFGQISTQYQPIVAEGSTVDADTLKGKWVAIIYAAPDDQ